jgi:hypothetical protein
MAKIPDNMLHPTAAAIFAHYEAKDREQKDTRAYLGWSEIGDPCERALWYSFRMAKLKQFDGRMLRLFDTGHREEDRVLQELRAIGCEVFSRDPATGGQFGCQQYGGHMRGHLDAVVKGLPEAPATPHLVDVKTCNDKKFAAVKKDGMQKTYPRYWSQAHGYMGAFNLTRGMYIFVNKNTDEIHTERFHFDESQYKRDLDKGGRIIFAAEPPQRLSNDPAWFECKFCDHAPICHGTDTMRVTCRSCLHATPEKTGIWTCARHGNNEIPIKVQREACQSHRYIPATLANFATATDASDADNWVQYQLKNGGQFINGQQPHGIDSAEIHDCKDKAALGLMADDDMAALRQDFGARIVE